MIYLNNAFPLCWQCAQPEKKKKIKKEENLGISVLGIEVTVMCTDVSVCGFYNGR